MFAKSYQRRVEQERRRALLAPLENARQLWVSERRQILEPESERGFENRFRVLDEKDQLILLAAEKSGGFAWGVLANSRPFDLRLTGPTTSDVLFTLSKPLRLADDLIEVWDGTVFVGVVESSAQIPLRKYSVRDARRTLVCEITGAFWRPWTFPITRSGVKVGEIRRNWSGVLHVRFRERASAEERVLVLAALFLIEMIHFEHSGVF